MTSFQSILYGAIQGLTEFLPVSSSAHLVLIPFFTGWADPGLAFDVALHWGTLIAAVAYFRSDIGLFITGFLGSLKGKRAPENILPWKIAVATSPGALIGLVFEKQAETIFRAPWILAITLSVMGILLFVADRTGKKNVFIQDIGWKAALIIGVFQGVAIVPGVSRSGITMTMALFLGLERETAVKFSFYLAIPITLGAGLLKLDFLIKNISDPTVLIGIASSALFGWVAIHLLITYVKSKSFLPFAIYRIGLATAVIAFLVFR